VVLCLLSPARLRRAVPRFGAVACLGLASVSAAHLEFLPVADTTLTEAAPDNNLGGQPFFNSGLTGPNAGLTRNRALVRFDIASQLPAGAVVQSAELILEVVGEPLDLQTPSEFRLHRLLRPWGEGTQTTESSPGLGLPALEGEATWNHRFALTTNTWAAPGAMAGMDYLETISASSFVYGIADSPYAFGPTPGLAADVQDWLDHPETNFGWILITASEATLKTARRFGAREDPLNSPRLLLHYSLPIRIESPVASQGQFQFEFAVEPEQQYVVQSRLHFGAAGDWAILTNLPPVSSAGRAVVVDTIADQARYYRVIAP
jgi:hypothetical protein